MRSISLDAFSLQEFDPGSRNRIWLEALPGLLEPVRLPALVARGASDGRTLLAIAGVHGDEYEGMEAIRLAFAKLDPKTMHGSFIGIPIANPFAYESRSRVAPLAVDGLNLARVFPGDPSSSPSRALAHAILSFVRATITTDDLLIDFHSGSADVAFAPLVGFRDILGPVASMSEEASRHFGLRNVWRIPDTLGPLNAETSRLGIPTIGTETTGRAGCIGEDVADYVKGINQILAYLDIVPGPMPPRLSDTARKTVNILAPASGFLRHPRQLHEPVRAGKVLGWLIDPFGSTSAEITSPVDGTLWAVRATPPTNTGELLFMIAASDDEQAGTTTS